MENKPIHKERHFSIELKSKNSLKNVMLANHKHEKMLIEGTIGKLKKIEFVEGIILEITGSRGVLTIDITQNEVQNMKK